ncbi:MAG: hypothetical protein HF962_02015 [Sulfurovum sp.]|nr:hypothetical protein [Sulfurovum sp.]
MTYIYAYSNHKYGLDRLRRMSVLYQELQSKGEEVEMLTNDFRAVSAIREYGVPACTTIESIWDIDMVAPQGAEYLIIDTPEDDAGKLEEYVALFRKVSKVANSCDESSRYGEEILDVDPMVDSYFSKENNAPKEDRCLFFYGDSDHEKWLSKNLDKLSDLNCELLLGEYFFLGYEDELKSVFSTIHDADEYRDIVATSSKVITFSLQCAYEANTAGARVVYVCGEVEECALEKLREFGILWKRDLEDITD